MSDTPETSTEASFVPSADDALTIGANVAARYGWAVFPCRLDKRPACPHGFKDASRDPPEIEALWQRYPGPLVGIATGAVSDIWVLDVDVKHQEAVDWWHLAHPRLLPTRAYRTRSGGVHCYYRDAAGLTNSTRRPVLGIDVRGEGGYVVFWFAAGLECLDESPPAPWPAWLRRAVAPPVAPATAGRAAWQGDPDTGMRGLLDKVAGAAEGERNALLFWAACRLFGRGLKAGEVEALLVPIAVSTGLADPEARRTIASAAGREAPSGGP
jgi:hypothetical protein